MFGSESHDHRLGALTDTFIPPPFLGRRLGTRLTRVPDPARVALRLLGLVLVVVGLLCLLMIAWPGPAQIAEVLGATCANDRHGSRYQCDWLDAADLLWTGFWVALTAGIVLRLITRPKGKGPLTIDLRRFRRP